MFNFENLSKEGKTVIYKESKGKLTDSDWELWGEKKTPRERVYVYRKIVTFEEAEQYELENEKLN